MRFVLFSLLVLMCVSCSSEQKSEQKLEATQAGEGTAAKATQKKEKPAKSKKKNYPKITMETAEEFLTQYGKENPETRIKIATRLGDIELELFEDTPLHRANFIMLIKRNYFDGTVFYRVINDFMIQGGNSDEWETQEKKVKIGSFKIPSEIDAGYKHLKGTLAMARDYTDNPEKLSSPYSFYIVQRGPILPEGVTYTENEKQITYSKEEREYYEKIGGTPSLDGEHTVFGRVTKGLEVIDKIAKTTVDDRDWPKEEVYINASVIR